MFDAISFEKHCLFMMKKYPVRLVTSVGVAWRENASFSSWHAAACSSAIISDDDLADVVE